MPDVMLEQAEVEETDETPAPPSAANEDIRLTDEQEQRLATYLFAEITRAEEETREYREKIILFRDFVDPKERRKSFPWEGCSSVFMPIPRIILDAYKSSFKQAIWRQRDPFTSNITSAEHAGIREEQIHDANLAAAKFAEFLARDPGHLNLEHHSDQWIEEFLTTGIGPVKLIIEKDIRTVKVKGGAQIAVVLRNGPRFYVVPVGTWVWPAGLWNSVQDMPWVGNWTVLTDEALRLRAKRPWNYQHVEDVLGSNPSGTGVHGDDWQNRLEKIGQAAQQTPGHKVYEIYLLWRLSDAEDAPYHDAVVTYSLHANKVLRFAYNPGGDGCKPYDYEVGSPRSGTIFGRGIIEPIVQPVRAINTAINQTFDSMTLANAPIIVYPEDSAAGTVLADGFAPGISLPYKEEKAEIDVLKLPDPSATSFTLVQFFQNVIERLSRIGPHQLGDVESAKRVAATVGMSSAQAGGELLNETIDRLRVTVGRIVARAFLLYNEHDPGIFVRVLGQEQGTLLQGIVQKSAEERSNLHEVLRLRLTVSSANKSQEIERQNTMATAQILFQWYERAIGLIQLYVQTQQDPVAGPVAKEILLSILKAAQEQMKRIVELANIPDSETLVPDLAAMLERMTPPLPPGAPAGPPTPGAPPSAPSGIPPELEQMMAGMVGGGAGPGQGMPQ